MRELGDDQRPLQLPECGLASALCGRQLGDSWSRPSRPSLADAQRLGRTDCSRSIIRSIPTASRRFPRATVLRRSSSPPSCSRGKDVVIGTTSEADRRPIFHPRHRQDGRRLRPDHRRRDAQGGHAARASAGCRPSCSRWRLPHSPRCRKKRRSQQMLILGGARVAPAVRPGAARSQSDLRRHHARHCSSS